MNQEIELTDTERAYDEWWASFILQRRLKGRETYGKGLDSEDPKYRDQWQSKMALEELTDANQYLFCDNERLRRKIATEIKEVRQWAIGKMNEVINENQQLRAALANSKDPCTYCQLPAAEQAKCRSGFPGCGRADDQLGCPYIQDSMWAHELQRRHERLRAYIAEDESAAQPIWTQDMNDILDGKDQAWKPGDEDPFTKESETKTMTDERPSHEILAEAVAPRVGSPMVLAAEWDRPGDTESPKPARHESVSIGVDDDFDDEPLPERTCSLENAECESCS